MGRRVQLLTPAEEREIELRARWEAWKPTNKAGDPFYLEYWPTDRGTYYIFFPNRNFGHEVLDKFDAFIANQWEPADTYRHLYRRYNKELDHGTQKD